MSIIYSISPILFFQFAFPLLNLGSACLWPFSQRSRNINGRSNQPDAVRVFASNDARHIFEKAIHVSFRRFTTQHTHTRTTELQAKHTFHAPTADIASATYMVLRAAESTVRLLIASRSFQLSRARTKCLAKRIFATH